MSTPDETRVNRYALQLGQEPQDAATSDAGDAIAQGQRDLTEVTRLEAARRKRIESESLQEITALQVAALAERQRLAGPAIPPAEERPREIFEPSASDAPRERPPVDRSAETPALPPVESERAAASPAFTPSPERQPPLQVEVAAKRELTVKLAEDSSGLIDAVTRQIEILLDERDRRMVQEIEQRLRDAQSRRQSPLGGTAS